MTSNTAYLEPTERASREFFSRAIGGSVVMLNLLRFRKVADYSASPELAPPTTISGAEAYRRYMDHTLPFLRRSSGDVIFMGDGGPWLIGPESERWDMAMLVRQSSVGAFLAFATDKAYLAGIGHRTAALDDSRLLPLVNGTMSAR